MAKKRTRRRSSAPLHAVVRRCMAEDGDYSPPAGTRLVSIHRGLSNGFTYEPGEFAIVRGCDPLPYVVRESDGADLGHVSLRRWTRA